MFHTLQVSDSDRALAEPTAGLNLRHCHHATRLSAAIACLLLTLLVAACGNDSNDASGGREVNANAQPSSNTAAMGNSSAVDSSPATAGAEGTKSVSTVKGDVEIPLHPERIVAEEYLGTLIALDVIPVGAPGLTLQNYYFEQALNGVADTGQYGQPSVENIVGLQPDLILIGSANNYDQLSKISPTLVIPYGELKNVHEELTYFGKLLDREEQAKAWLKQYDERVAAARAKVDAAIPDDATFSIMEVGDKSTWVYGDNFGRGGQPIYQALGRKPPERVRAEIMEKQWMELSAEMLDHYAGDYIIMTSNSRTVEDFESDPLWGSLPAVKNGRLYVWPEERSWYYDPLAVQSQIEELTAWLAPDH